MRFTKIPLIATLMAVALSLLIVLPGLAQQTNITDGRQNNGVISVGVFDDITDAQTTKLVRSTAAGTPAPDESRWPYTIDPSTGVPGTGTIGTTAGSITPADAAYLADRRVDPRDTFFNNTLYVSNGADAYNTVLVQVRTNDTRTTKETCKVNVDGTTADESKDAFVTATVRNNRSGESTKFTLAHTGAGGSDSLDLDGTQTAAEGAYTQGFFKVVPEDAADGTKNKNTTGPVFCTDDTQAGIQPGTADTDADDTEIAQIVARHGDRLTVTTDGGSGQVQIVVDGEGPEFSAVTPDDNTVTRGGSRLGFGFEVRDDDSGLRHDGESMLTVDGDYKEVNPDGDQQIASEPLSVNPGAAIPDLNGPAADIDVNVQVNAFDDDGDPSDSTGANDISASGTWRMAGSRAGVAYSFSASGGYSDGSYLYQLEATDRAGNLSKTDALADTDAADPFVFRVDDEAPDLNIARTGITYDTAKNVEKVDRSFIALDFNDTALGGGDPLGDVNKSSITVAGHTVVDVIHPSKAPRINRGEIKITSRPAKVDSAGTEPATGKTAPADPFTRTVLPTVSERSSVTLNDNLTLAGTCDLATAPTATTVTTTVIGLISTLTGNSTDTGTPPLATTEEVNYCKAWDNFRKYLLWSNANTAYNEYVADLKQWEGENPATDIEGKPITEPRSRVYVELAEPLAADATPSVVVLGGAALDLAGNANDSETLSKSTDWIAPTLTVSVTATAGDRPVAKGDGSFKVDVRSDEELRRRPKVYFVEITATKTLDKDGKETGEYTYAVTTHGTNDNVDAAASLTLQEDDEHWSKSYKVGSIESHFDGLFGVVVVGMDADSNIGATAGWSAHEHREDTTAEEDAMPDEGDALDLSKLDGAGLLAEIDKVFNNDNKDADGNSIVSGIGSVTPRSDKDGKETESANPFVKLDFGSEAGEYSDGKFKDSHDEVGIDKITLGGENVMGNLNRVSATSHSLITRDLAVGSYKVEYTASDDAGNEYEGEFSFTVNERQPYEVDVKPGWNLVSLPATPLEPAIGDVLAGNGYITPVLGYQGGDWVTAVREEDGTWRGRLTEIVGGYGYWVHARTFESIETMLAEADPAATLPTVSVTAGWNLLGVLDIFQNKAGEAPGADGDNGDEADNYFSSIPWKVAYTYDTTKSLWVKSTPKATAKDADNNEVQEILNGNGYWVWSPSPSTLAP